MNYCFLRIRNRPKLKYFSKNNMQIRYINPPRNNINNNFISVDIIKKFENKYIKNNIVHELINGGRIV